MEQFFFIFRCALYKKGGVKGTDLVRLFLLFLTKFAVHVGILANVRSSGTGHRK